jgi:hypothetical protein
MLRQRGCRRGKEDADEDEEIAEEVEEAQTRQTRQTRGGSDEADEADSRRLRRGRRGRLEEAQIRSTRQKADKKLISIVFAAPLESIGVRLLICCVSFAVCSSVHAFVLSLKSIGVRHLTPYCLLRGSMVAVIHSR